jgi:hypothetical protein
VVDVPVVTLDDGIDLANVRQVHAALAAAVPNTARGLVVDLSDVAYVDSRIALAHKAGTTTAHAAPTTPPRRPRDLASPQPPHADPLDKQLPLDATVERAKAEIRRGPG